MNKLAKQLITLGNETPNLRPHLKPILDHISKTSSFDYSTPKSVEECRVIFEEIKTILERKGYYLIKLEERLPSRKALQFSFGVKVFEGEGRKSSRWGWLGWADTIDNKISIRDLKNTLNNLPEHLRKEILSITIDIPEKMTHYLGADAEGWYPKDDAFIIVSILR